MRDSVREKNKFGMLQPKALAYDVDPAGDYMKPGNSPAEQAFQLLRCGYEMLLHVSDNAFPTLDRRTLKRGPKWVRQGILFFGEAGTMLLAHTTPALLVQLDGRLTGDEPPELTTEHHRKLYDAVRSFYPVHRAASNFVNQCMAEFKVMEDHEPRKKVAEGVEPPNEYSEALMRGENPDDDPELLAMQREYATDFFIDRAIYLAVGQSLNPNDRKLLDKKFAQFPTASGPEAAELRARSRRAWIEGSRPYLEYARLDAQ